MLPRNLTLFDLDHTLLKVNVSFHFGVFLYRHKFLTTNKMLNMLIFYCCHKLGFITLPVLHQRAAGCFFQGKSIEALNDIIAHFLEKEFHRMANPPVVKQLRLAQSKGDYTIILSSSPDFIVRKIAEKFGVDEWAATQYAVSKDRKLGSIDRFMEGKDKAHYTLRKMADLNIPKERVTGYTDSSLDIPFLEAVGNAVAVNPDKILRKKCQQKGWQIL
jgi:HAD superfamily hydrolase (TIGR01490 family)